MSRYQLSNQSDEYRKLRDELTQAEIALRVQREKVAALRRQLPQDTPVEVDHVLREGPPRLDDGDTPVREMRLSELIGDSGKPLVLMHFMYGKAQTDFCPMCTLWADGYDGIVPHLERRVNFAILAAGEVSVVREYARSRSWRNVRIISAGDSTLKRDLGFETDDGSQLPGVSVFTRDDDGTVRHFYSGGALMEDGEFRGMDLLSPLWTFLDLTPEGRGDFMPSKQYE